MQTVVMATLYAAVAAGGSLQNHPKLSPGELKRFSAFWCPGPVGFNIINGLNSPDQLHLGPLPTPMGLEALFKLCPGSFALLWALL